MTRACGECGCPLPADWPAGVCPDCVWAADPLGEAVPESPDAASDWLGRVLRALRERPFPEDRYAVGPRLRRGGQGEIFPVQDAWLLRKLALKRIPSAQKDSEPHLLRFLQEAQIASQLAHPGVLPIYDVGLDREGCLFYTTALLPGSTFGDVIRQVHDAPASHRAWLRVVGQMTRVCEILAFAHAAGVVHRDLKPSNILLGDFGDLYVIDWGSARLLDPAAAAPDPAVPSQSPLTSTRAEHLSHSPHGAGATHESGFPGTPGFLPPEAFEPNPAALGEAADIYAAGVILYELLCGAMPYAGAVSDPPKLEEWRRAIRSDPVSVRDLNPLVAPELAAICAKAMARIPADRYGSMREFAADLEAFSQIRVVSAYESGRWAELKALIRRNKTVCALAAVLVMGAFGGSLAVIQHRLQARLDAQNKALSQAAWARRNGQWPQVLEHLREAAQAGCHDYVRLGLERIEAWTVLAQPGLARAELNRLIQRTDLGTSRGLVLLKAGAFELSDPAARKAGEQHVREALAAGLEPANKAFATGLLAPSTPEALQHFREALELDPYHHGAHALSLGLEFLSGDTARLNSHLELFKVLYPQDPSRVPIQALRAALDGRLSEAEQLIAGLRGAANDGPWQYLAEGLQLAAQAPKLYNLETLLEGAPAESVPMGPLVTGALALFSNQQVKVIDPALRLPQTPCVKGGLEKGMRALFSLFFSTAEPGEALAEIKDATQKHPEALLPLTAAMLLDSRRPTTPEKLHASLEMQTELLELALSMPSVLPQVQRAARFLAALTEVELGCRTVPPSQQARQQCATNLRQFIHTEDASPVVCKAYFNLAFELGEWDLARQILSQWERVSPEPAATLRYRIPLELADGAYGKALPLIDGILARDPQDAWALNKRQTALREMEKWLSPSKPPGDSSESEVGRKGP